MGLANYGNQKKYFDFRNDASSESFNKLLSNVIPKGIHVGGDLSTSNSGVAVIAPFTIEIEDSAGSNILTKIDTTSNVNVSGIALNDYITCKYTWLNNINNYLDFESKSSYNEDDIVFGKVETLVAGIPTFNLDEKTGSTVLGINLSSPQDGDLLIYDSTYSKWNNKAVSGDATIDESGVINIPLLSFIDQDVTIGSSPALDGSNISGVSSELPSLAEGNIWIGNESGIATPSILGGGFYNAYVKVSDTKPTSTAGGDTVATTRTTRDINKIDSDDAGICSVAGNQITLEAGTYDFEIRSPFYNAAGRILLNLYDDTAGVDLSSEGSVTIVSATVQGDAWITGSFTLTVQSDLEIQYIATTGVSSGLGINQTLDAAYESIFTTGTFKRRA